MSGDHLGYARVSTVMESLELQLDALHAAGCVRVWSDVGTDQHSRSGLTDVLGCLRPGDTLVVRRLDRIGRRTGELIQLVTDLAARDIGVRSLTEPIDTTTPSGRMILDTLAAFAQTEANLVRESTHAGLAVARAYGRRGGRPTVVTPAHLAEAHWLRESGSSFSEIAQPRRAPKPWPSAGPQCSSPHHDPSIAGRRSTIGGRAGAHSKVGDRPADAGWWTLRPSLTWR